MSQLPDQFRSLHGTRRLPFPEPLYHSFRVPSWRCSGGVRRGGGFDEEVAESGERGGFLQGRERFVVADVAGFDECSADVEGVCLIQHRLNQPLHSVFGSTEWPQSRNSQRAARTAEYQITPSASTFTVGVGSFAEVRERELDNVECTPEIRLELISDLIIILVFASANHAIARAIGYDVHPSPMFQALCEDGVDG